MDEVLSPTFVGALWLFDRFGAAGNPLLAPAMLAHLKFFQAAEPMHVFVDVGKDVAAEEHREASISPAAPVGGMSTRRCLRGLFVTPLRDPSLP